MGDIAAGQTLFLAYAAGCIPLRQERGQIREDVVSMLRAANAAGYPVEVKVLQSSFPDAVAALYRFSSQLGADPWAEHIVSRYWRTQHAGSTPVWTARVLRVLPKVSGLHFVKVTKLGDRFEHMVENPRALSLVPGVTVRIHVHTIAEYDEPTS